MGTTHSNVAPKHVEPLFALFLPNLAIGGAERVLLAIASEIAGRGYRCDLITAAGGGQWERSVPVNVRHVCLHKSKPLWAIPRLAEYLRSHRPTALLSTVFAANLAALAARKIAGTNTRCVVREALRIDEDVRSPSIATTLVNRLAVRWLYPQADAVIALSAGLGDIVTRFAGISAQRLWVIPNPCLSVPEQRRPTSRNVPIVLGCARLEPNKDFSTLLRAFAIVLKHRPAKLVILGDGSEKEALQKLSVALAIDSDVTFAGFVSDPQRWMADADVFVSTSRTEGFPNALMEAVASACPVVATASSDAVSEILDQGRLGRIVPVGDVEAVAREIVEALERSPFSTNPEAHLSRYSLPRIATQYLAVLTGECSATA